MPRDVASRRRGGRVRQPLQRIAGDSLSAISPLDGDKTIDLCNGGDSCAPTATTSVSYRVYVEGGMARQAAAFVALRLSAPSPGSGAAHSSPCTDASVTLTCTRGVRPGCSSLGLTLACCPRQGSNLTGWATRPAGPLPLIFVDDTMNQIVYRAVQHGSHVATRIH
jgi:hypothetical protein